jgi:hypothetical protein
MKLPLFVKCFSYIFFEVPLKYFNRFSTTAPLPADLFICVLG